MSALLDKVNIVGSPLAGVAAAPGGPLYLGRRTAAPVTSTPAAVSAIVQATTPGCIEPCKVENGNKDIDDSGDVMSS